MDNSKGELGMKLCLLIFYAFLFFITVFLLSGIVKRRFFYNFSSKGTRQKQDLHQKFKKSSTQNVYSQYARMPRIKLWLVRKNDAYGTVLPGKHYDPDKLLVHPLPHLQDTRYFLKKILKQNNYIN